MTGSVEMEVFHVHANIVISLIGWNYETSGNLYQRRKYVIEKIQLKKIINVILGYAASYQEVMLQLKWSSYNGSTLLRVTLFKSQVKNMLAFMLCK